MASSTTTLMSVSAQAGVLTGGTYQTAQRDGEYIPVQVNISAGTATVLIEGRMTPLGAWVTLWSTSATDSAVIMRTPEVRARLSAASGATVLVSTGVPVRG